MPSLPFYYSDFRGGFNSKDAADLLTDNQSRSCQNVQGTTRGAIVKRNGLNTFASPANVLKSMFAYETPATRFLIATGSTGIYSISTGGTVTSIGGAAFSTDARWDFVQSQSVAGSGPVYMMNGIDTPQQWSGSGNTTNWVATTGSVPNGKYMVVAGNRIWVSGVAATPNRVYFSDLIPGNNGPVTWPVANVSIFDENDGNPITGLGIVGPYVLVCKARKLYVITDFNTGDARRLSDNIGCVAHRSIAIGPEGTYFLGEDRGVYLTNGSKLTPISDNIQPTIDATQAGQKPNAAGAYYQGHYYLSLDQTGAIDTNDVTLDYDATLQSWWLHTFGSNEFAIWHPVANVAGLYSAKGTSAIVDQCFVPGVALDNGTQFLWQWKGPWQSPTFYRRRRFPTPYFKKNFRQIRLEGSGTVDLSLGYDFYPSEVTVQTNIFSPVPSGTFGGAGTFSVDGTFGGLATISRARQYSVGTHNAVSLCVSATSSTVNDTVNSYVLMVQDRKDLVVT